MEGFETVMFRSQFDSWPQSTDVAAPEDGKGKVAGELCLLSFGSPLQKLNI